MKKLRLLFLSVVLIGLDQLTKYLATIKLKGNNPFELIEGVFEFYYHENNGAVWGILSGKVIFLLIFTCVLLTLLLYFYFKIPMEKRYLPLRILAAVVIAGAIGNMIDRFTYGYVVDFLYFKLIDFPIFNVADCYITVAAFTLLFLFFFYYKDEDFKFLSTNKNHENSKS